METEASSTPELQDLTLVCQQCGDEFEFTEREQVFFREMGFVNPRYCPSCRKARKNHGARNEDWQDFYEVTCAKCGVQTTVPFKPVHGRPVYCRNCLSAIRDTKQTDNHNQLIDTTDTASDEIRGFGLSIIDDAERPYETLENQVASILKKMTA